MLSLVDIAGANTTVPLSTPNITARWVNIAITGSGTVRLGGPEAAVNRGLPLLAGAYNFAPVLSQDGRSTSPYSLGQMNVYIPLGATVSVLYEPFN